MKKYEVRSFSDVHGENGCNVYIPEKDEWVFPYGTSIPSIRVLNALGGSILEICENRDNGLRYLYNADTREKIYDGEEFKHIEDNNTFLILRKQDMAECISVVDQGEITKPAELRELGFDAVDKIHTAKFYNSKKYIVIEAYSRLNGERKVQILRPDFSKIWPEADCLLGTIEAADEKRILYGFMSGRSGDEETIYLIKEDDTLDKLPGHIEHGYYGGSLSHFREAGKRMSYGFTHFSGLLLYTTQSGEPRILNLKTKKYEYENRMSGVGREDVVFFGVCALKLRTSGFDFRERGENLKSIHIGKRRKGDEETVDFTLYVGEKKVLEATSEDYSAGIIELEDTKTYIAFRDRFTDEKKGRRGPMIMELFDISGKLLDYFPAGESVRHMRIEGDNVILSRKKGEITVLKKTDFKEL